MRTALLVTSACLTCLTLTSCDPGSDLLGTLPPAELTADEPRLIYSAPALYGFMVRWPAEVDPSASCPRVTVSGGTQTIEGGCTDPTGVTWFGMATMPSAFDSDAPTAGAIIFDGFGRDQPQSGCPMTPDSERRTGRIDISDQSDGSIEFAIDLSWKHGEADSSCVVASDEGAIRYVGRLTIDGTRQTWSGSGVLGSVEMGRLEVSTEDEVYDPSQCEAEALSGRTLASADGREAIITYDGASDCTDPPLSPWTLDGAPQPAIGIGCRAVPGAQTGALPPLAALLALALWRARRPRQTS